MIRYRINLDSGYYTNERRDKKSVNVVSGARGKNIFSIYRGNCAFKSTTRLCRGKPSIIILGYAP